MLKRAIYALCIVASIVLMALAVAQKFEIAGTKTSWMEMLASLTGGWAVWLLVKEHASTWPVNIVSCVTTGIVYWEGKLYANALLQILFVILCLLGLYWWLRGGKNHTELPIAYSAWATLIVLFGIGSVLTLVIWWWLAGHDDPSPFLDALTTAFSIIGTYMQTKKLMENWPVWIIIDAIYIPLCISQKLYFLAAISFVYLVMAVVGWIDWRRTAPRLRAA